MMSSGGSSKLSKNVSTSGVERIAWIGDRLVDASDQIEPAIDFPQQQQCRVGGQRAAVESDINGLSSEAFQRMSFSITLCHCEALGLCRH